MKQKMIAMLVVMAILFGGIFAYKMIKSLIMNHYLYAAGAPIVTVTAMKAEYALWEPKLKVVGTLRAIRGVNVTTELAGMVQKIYFTPGEFVQEGTVLVQLNADTDNAQLKSLQAGAELAQINYNRDQAQLKIHAISQAVLDKDAADLKDKQAQVTQQEAVVAKKTIRAPFTGRLGISAVNPGQYLKTGDKIVSLQALDPIYLDFYVPQQALAQLKNGQDVNFTVDTFKDQKFSGKITTIEPNVDINTRNVEVEATVPNTDTKLAPGMFATVLIGVDHEQRLLTVPQTAISFNPYGEVVYVLKATDKKQKGQPIYIATQKFVTTGETRGDQIQVLTGLKENDEIVTSGQLKLKNGSQVIINNTVTPSNNPTPQVVDE